MREIIFNMSLITLLFGCNQSENYLENHKVFPCSPEIVQEKKYRISIKEANDLYVKYLYDRKEIKDLDYDETLCIFFSEFSYAKGSSFWYLDKCQYRKNN